MAEDGCAESAECVNMLYLASTKRERNDQVPSSISLDDIGTLQQADDVDPDTQNTSNLQHEAPQPRVRQLTKPVIVTSDLKEPEQICPRVNCPEKIIICFDVSDEMDKESFRSRAGDKFTAMKLTKRAIGIFLHSKHNLNRKHEFALVILREDSMWMSPFSNDPGKILHILDEFETVYPTESFDLSSMFDAIEKNVKLPIVKDPSTIPPPYVIRTLLFYGRSHCIPKLSNKQAWNLLLTSPHFFIDACYIHEAPSDDNECAKVFDALCELDTKGLSYIFEVSKNPTRLYDCMAQLLPHPLQRPLQNDVSYKLEPMSEH